MAVQAQEVCGLGAGGGKAPVAGGSYHQSGGSGVDEAEGRRPSGRCPCRQQCGQRCFEAGLGEGEGTPKDPEEETAGASGKKKDEDVVAADVLSDIGDRKDKKEASSRVSKMLKLVKSVQKQVGPEKAKALNSSFQALQKLEKNKKISLEKAKDTLFDAALEIKEVKAL